MQIVEGRRRRRGEASDDRLYSNSLPPISKTAIPQTTWLYLQTNDRRNRPLLFFGYAEVIKLLGCVLNTLWSGLN